MSPVRHITVTPQESEQKLFQFLIRRLGGEVPGSAIMRWIRTGQVRVDSARKKPFDRVHAGQSVRIPPMAGPPAPGGREPETRTPGNLPVLFEDAELLILNKPSNIPVHGGTGHSASIAQWLQSRYSEASWRPTPVHRLDRDTTGVLVVAKSYQCLRGLQGMWKQGQVLKTYLAWVQGGLRNKGWKLLSDRLAKAHTARGKRVVPGEGKKALAYVKPVLHQDEATLVVIVLITGRTHQIRVQLATLGHGILGDPKYGHPGADSMLLHCWHLSWPGREFTAPPPWERSYAIPAGISPATLLEDQPGL